MNKIFTFEGEIWFYQHADGFCSLLQNVGEHKELEDLIIEYFGGEPVEGKFRVTVEKLDVEEHI